jgi:hypothetical protein
VLALVVMTTTLVAGNSGTAGAALSGSIPYTVTEVYNPSQFLHIGGGDYLVSCRYFVLVEFDASQAFYQDTADGPKPYIMARRGQNGALTASRAYERIPGLAHQTGDWAANPPVVNDVRFDDIVAPAGKLFYIWYGLQLNADQQTSWAPSESQCLQLQYFQASGQAPTNARNVLGLYPQVSPIQVTVRSGLERNVDVGEEVPITMTVVNSSTDTLEDMELLGDGGLSFASSHMELVSGPDPAPPTSLAPGASMTFSYVVRPIATGNIEVVGTVAGTLDGEETTDDHRLVVNVPPELEVALTTTANGSTAVGDEFDVVATLTNHDEDELTDITAEPLSQRPGGKLSVVEGPVDAAGADVRTNPLTIAPEETATIRWRLKAEERGKIELTAPISGRDPREGSLYFLSESLEVAIEAPSLTLSNVRLQPGSIVPGDFGVLRGTVTNDGTVDVTDIDVAVDGNPTVIEFVLPGDDPDGSASPRIASLAIDESKDFVLPVAVITDAGDLATWQIDLTIWGSAELDGETVEAEDAVTLKGPLDLSPYWSTILGDVRANLLSDTIEFFEGVNEWGESSTLGGVAVGSSEGALAAFQKLGDGILGANDFIAEEIGSGGERLTETANSVVAASREYLHTHTAKEMAADLKALGYDVTIEGVGTFGEWLRDIDRAQASGDAREVARLLSEPATTLAISGGTEAAVERVAGKLFTKVVQSAAGRKVASYLKRAPEPVDEDIWLPTPEEPEIPYDQMVGRELQDLKDMPTGVAITGETVARAGLTADEHGWMIDMAREHGVAFFVRPRPETAAKFARLGYNAKPMAIKLKSISEIDHRWLGWDDYADAEGLVVFREPKDPLEAMKAAVEAGELEYGGREIDDIIARYNLRRAEWKSFEKPFGEAGPTVDPRDGILHKLNGDTLGPDGSIVPGEGFTIQRYGKTIRTKVTIDPDGVIRFSHNNQPVYSDIDLMAIAKPDGSPIDPELHDLISQKAGFGIDSQHGDTALTSDFPNWEQAKKFGTQYTNEHKRGGDPLVIVQSDVTTLGYVDTVSVPEGPIPGSGYDLYGKMSVTYEGAGRR